MNEVKMRSVIGQRCLTISNVIDNCGFNRTSFYLKMHGKREFKASEITRLEKYLNLTQDEKERIFFNQKVAKTET